MEALKKLSQETKIPQAELLRQAVDLLLENW
ncbi:ribbon-helix-helix domain-containing protein [Thermodesulforhabdus norvegica]|nr:ribbon-helix-helix domain-containing protein [Thermodesulforhabdus norvegica]